MTISLADLVNKHQTSPRCVVDVGGYKGDYADLINKKFGCTIIIYEPIAAYYSEICKRFANDKNIKVVPAAAGKETKIRKMYISNASTSFFQGWNNSSSVELVPTVQLSQEIKDIKVDILKLNCEGAEYEIIDDLDKYDLIEDIDEILVQFHKILRKEKAEEILSKTHRKTFDFKWQLWVKK